MPTCAKRLIFCSLPGLKRHSSWHHAAIVSRSPVESQSVLARLDMPSSSLKGAGVDLSSFDSGDSIR